MGNFISNFIGNFLEQIDESEPPLPHEKPLHDALNNGSWKLYDYYSNTDKITIGKTPTIAVKNMKFNYHTGNRKITMDRTTRIPMIRLSEHHIIQFQGSYNNHKLIKWKYIRPPQSIGIIVLWVHESLVDGMNDDDAITEIKRILQQKPDPNPFTNKGGSLIKRKVSKKKKDKKRDKKFRSMKRKRNRTNSKKFRKL